jgi:hypothetical protein
VILSSQSLHVLHLKKAKPLGLAALTSHVEELEEYRKDIECGDLSVLSGNFLKVEGAQD